MTDDPLQPPLSLKMGPAGQTLNGQCHISTTGHLIHFVFGSRVGFQGGWWIEWRYLRFNPYIMMMMMMMITN